MFCYYKAKADPKEGVTKDTYRIWRGRNPNDRPDLYRKLHGSRSINEKSHACLAKCL